MRKLAVLCGFFFSSFLGGAIAQSVTPWQNLAAQVIGSVGISIFPATNTQQPAILSTQSGPTSGSASTNYYNQMSISQDALDASSFGSLDGYQFIHTFGGSNLNGARQALDVKATFNGASSASNVNRSYVAGVFQQNVMTGDGGTDTGAGAKGSFYGANIVVRANNAAATNLAAIIGGEVDVVGVSGATYRTRSGWSVVAWSPTQGTSSDAAYRIGTATGQLGWANGIILSSANGASALSSGGCVICTEGSTQTIATGMDLSAYTISGNFLAGPGGYKVSGAGITTQPLTTPASSAATCSAGQIEWDTGFIYVCTAANTWKRATLSSF